MSDMPGAIWALVVAIAGFLLRQAYNDWLAEKRRRHERRTYLLALCAEIKLNNDEIRDCLGKFPSVSVLQEFLKEGRKDPPQPSGPGDCHRPLFIMYYLDFVFRGNASILTSMPDPVIKSVIEYYGKLETVGMLADAIQLHSFADISLASRYVLLASIQRNLIEAQELGKSILGATELLLLSNRVV